MRARNLTVVLVFSASLAFAGTTPSLGTVLTPDGEIMDGASGSFDPAGFRMEYGPDGEPLFVEEDSSPLEPILPPAGQDLDGTWYPLGSGVNDGVNAIAVSGSDVYVGGEFTEAGGNPANHIARWDGISWSALGSGVNESVWAIAVGGSNVYVGGDFWQAGGNPANLIARWDGSSWSTLGSHPWDGVNDRVYAIDYSDTGMLYVGGEFTEAGGNPANHIARWDGISWLALGSGVNERVRAIAVSGSDVYVGGFFTEAGGNPANFIARWSGSSWSTLGSGISWAVYAIAVSGSNIYVGGNFLQAGGNPANYIARWNGSSWSALGSGVGGYAMAIAVSGSDLYVGGYFTQAGGTSANRIARWDGGSWSALGSGVDDQVNAIAVSDSDIYAGGLFTQAGGNPASRIARWASDTGIEPSPEMESSVLHASPNPTAAGIELSFQSTGPSPLTLEVYDAAGRIVRTQELGTLPSGAQTRYWDGLDGSGHALAQGVYFLRLSSADLEASTRVVLLR